MCTCGVEKTHKIWRTATADGKDVVGWSDGDVTWAFGYAIRGVGLAHSSATAGADLRASWALRENVGMLDANEVATAFNALRRVARQPLTAACSWRFSGEGWHARDARAVIFRALSKEASK